MTYGTNMDAHDQFDLNAMLLGETAAVELVSILANAFHMWDDLVDKDHAVSPEAASLVFYNLLVVLPTNRFYADHFHTLHPILVNAITNWQIATDMERDETDLEAAFILRSSAVDLIVACARILGGHDHSIMVGRKVHQYTHREGFTGYLNNLKQERIARASKE